ncbi:hypothetical protein M1N77_03195 [Thermodesulfovibrionales bacterium]|nr:hypothetical protein [Thermodesulfovibrionales bacterium]
MQVPNDLLTECLSIANITKYWPILRFASNLFGLRDIDFLVVSTAYFRILDNKADSDMDVSSAKAYIQKQRDIFVSLYEGEKGVSDIEGKHSSEIRCAQIIASYDYSRKLYPFLIDLIDTIIFDTERRWKVLTERDVEDYFAKTGRCVLNVERHFFKNGSYPESFVHFASLGYLWADTILDLEKDLDVGIINIPSEDIERFRLDLNGPSLFSRHDWIRYRGDIIKWYLKEANNRLRKVRPCCLRLEASRMLRHKEKRLYRMLTKHGI